jgi:heme-degrading monooxygenase HmoA
MYKVLAVSLCCETLCAIVSSAIVDPQRLCRYYSFISYYGFLTMISRIWHGYTTRANADAYENLLKEEIFVGITNRQIKGYRGIHLLRRDVDNGVEFITIMWFDSIEAVKEFAGGDYERAVVPERARALLSRFDGRSQHYTVEVEDRGDVIASA